MERSKSATTEKVRNYIHNDLVFCILSKLPLKSLKRFGCVRKSWSLLFQNHHFMNIFRNNFISNHHSYYDDTSLLLQISHTEFYTLSGDRHGNVVKLDWPNPFQENDPCFCILDSGSITGILCLYTQNGRSVFWNPATKELKVIPLSPLECVPPYQMFRSTLHGFGYDHVRDDYKLIKLVSYSSPTTRDCEDLGMSFEDMPWEDISCDSLWEIYSHKSNSWRKLDIHVSGVRGSVAGERLYLDGSCHWWHYIDLPDAEIALASFDLVNEVFWTTPIPLDTSLDMDDDFSYYSRQIYLMVLNGFIASITWSFGSPTFDILILDQVGVKESWTKLFIIESLSCNWRPIGTGKMMGDIFFTKEDCEIVWFNLSTQMIEELGIKEQYLGQILIYKENFLPFGRINY